MEVRDFLNHLWYDADVIIVECGKSDFVIDTLERGFDIEEAKEDMLFIGKNSEMRSDLYKHLLRKDIRSFGTIDGYIVVELY